MKSRRSQIGWCVLLMVASLALAGCPRRAARADEPASEKAAAKSAEAEKPTSGEGEKHPAEEAKHKAGEHHNPHDLSHGNAGSELDSPVEWKYDLAIYTFVVFLLLLAILWKFAWGPIMDGLAKREAAIAESIAAAQKANDEAKALLARHEAEAAAAQAKVRQLLDEGRKDAEASSAKIVADAQAAAKRDKDQALAQIEAAKNAAIRDLASKSVDTAISLAGQIVGRQLGPQDHAQLVRDALAQFPSQN